MQRATSNEKINYANETNLTIEKFWQTRTMDSRDTRRLARHSYVSIRSICGTPQLRTSQNFAWQFTEQHTLHPESSTTKLVTARWVQGVRVVQKDSRRKGTPLRRNYID
jgi:hypothetical protein